MSLLHEVSNKCSGEINDLGSQMSEEYLWVLSVYAAGPCIHKYTEKFKETRIH